MKTPKLSKADEADLARFRRLWARLAPSDRTVAVAYLRAAAARSDRAGERANIKRKGACS